MYVNGYEVIGDCKAWVEVRLERNLDGTLYIGEVIMTQEKFYIEDVDSWVFRGMEQGGGREWYNGDKPFDTFKELEEFVMKLPPADCEGYCKSFEEQADGTMVCVSCKEKA